MVKDANGRDILPARAMSPEAARLPVLERRPPLRLERRVADAPARRTADRSKLR